MLSLKTLSLLKMILTHLKPLPAMLSIVKIILMNPLERFTTTGKNSKIKITCKRHKIVFKRFYAFYM